jgi:hypothetical protein
VIGHAYGRDRRQIQRPAAAISRGERADQINRVITVDGRDAREWKLS